MQKLSDAALGLGVQFLGQQRVDHATWLCYMRLWEA